MKHFHELICLERNLPKNPVTHFKSVIFYCQYINFIFNTSSFRNFVIINVIIHVQIFSGDKGSVYSCVLLAIADVSIGVKC